MIAGVFWSASGRVRGSGYSHSADVCVLSWRRDSPVWNHRRHSLDTAAAAGMTCMNPSNGRPRQEEAHRAHPLEAREQVMDQRPTSVLCPRDLDALTDPLFPTRTQVGCTLSRHSVACSTEPVRHKRNGTARQLAGQTRHCPWLMDLAFLPDTDTTPTPDDERRGPVLPR